MKWLTGFFAFAIVAGLGQDVHVDACGVKLTVKSSAPRKAVAHTSNPSEVLLLGDPPSRLKRDLTAAGHHVDVASSTSSAPKKNYAVVITDAKLQDDAKSSFPGAIVVVRSGDVDGDMHSLESVVARRPLRTDQRLVADAKENRSPIAVGPPQDDHRPTNAKEPTPPAPPNENVATAAPKPAETKPAEPAKPAEPTPVKPVEPPTEKITKVTPPPAETRPAVKANASFGEVYFGLNKTKLGSTAALDKAAKKLAADPDVHVTIEGHADPTGTPEGNQVLGQARAEWVRDYLVQAGIDQARLDVISYGDTHLKYGKSDGRNRRVAIIAK